MNPRMSRVLLVSFAALGPVWMVGRCALQPDGGLYPGVRRGSVPGSIVILSTDRLGLADVLAGDGEIKPRLPSLRSLANHGISVHHAFAAADRSPAAEASLVFSLLPSSHGVVEWDRKPSARLPSVFDAFAGSGFTTAAVSNAPLLWDLDLGRGTLFSHELDTDDPEELVNSAAKWLLTVRDRDFVLWVHCVAPERGDSPAVLEELVKSMTRVLRSLRRYEETCVVAMSTTARYRANLEVPLIFRLPADDVTDAIRKGPVSTLDVVPTLAKMYRVSMSATPHVGRSLVDPPHKPLFSGRHFVGVAPFEWCNLRVPRLGITAAHYVVLEGAPEPDLFFRFSDRHGREAMPLSELEMPKTIETLTGLLADAKKKRLKGPPAQRIKLKPEALRTLERLGHLSGKSN